MGKKLYILIFILFLFRTVYGLASEFWFTDEMQIYLIGLKSYTTGTWPYYGPDLVYTNTQIPGALQGILVSLPFHLLKIPESPALFLNILSFASFSFLAYYITKRIPSIPKWIVWVLVMTTPWAMYYSTRVVNPSYAILFSIPFFICALDLLSIYKKPLINKGLALFTLGITTTLIMQLHMSWVLLVPFAGLVFFSKIKSSFKEQIIRVGYYVLGLLIGILTLIPTLLNNNLQGGDIESNIVFNGDNWSNLVIIILRFLSFASFEIPYVLGGSTEARLEVISEQIWMAPFTIFLLIVGFAQLALFISSFFLNKSSEGWVKLKWIAFGSTILLYASFFFSVKGPSSHTFYIMMPLAVIYSFHAYEWIISKKAFALKLLKGIAISGILFHIGLGIYNFKHKSLYLDRAKVQQSLDEMDHEILGTRRADTWGYGY